MERSVQSMGRHPLHLNVQLLGTSARVLPEPVFRWPGDICGSILTNDNHRLQLTARGFGNDLRLDEDMDINNARPRLAGSGDHATQGWVWPEAYKTGLACGKNETGPGRDCQAWERQGRRCPAFTRHPTVLAEMGRRAGTSFGVDTRQTMAVTCTRSSWGAHLSQLVGVPARCDQSYPPRIPGIDYSVQGEHGQKT
jgi:hypothetical protein